MCNACCGNNIITQKYKLYRKKPFCCCCGFVKRKSSVLNNNCNIHCFLLNADIYLYHDVRCKLTILSFSWDILGDIILSLEHTGLSWFDCFKGPWLWFPATYQLTFTTATTIFFLFLDLLHWFCIWESKIMQPLCWSSGRPDLLAWQNSAELWHSTESKIMS